MNSRKWQVGMVALIVLTCGLASFAPFVWRYLKTSEKTSLFWALSVVFGEFVWFLFSNAGGGTGTLTWAIGGLVGVLTILGSIFGAVWLFRPFTKTEQTEDIW